MTVQPVSRCWIRRSSSSALGDVQRGVETAAVHKDDAFDDGQPKRPLAPGTWPQVPVGIDHEPRFVVLALVVQ